MLIGTDISLAVCKREGYMIMEYAGKGPDRLMIKKVLQKDARCEFVQYEPDYCLEEQGYSVFENGTCMGDPGEGSYQLKNGEYRNGKHMSLQAKRFCSRPTSLDECYSAQDIWDLYLQDKKDIDSICGMAEDPPTFPTTPHQLLHLASDVACMGRMRTS